MGFKRFIEQQELKEVVENLGNTKEDIPFEIGGKQFILRFFGRPTHMMFPYSPIAGGYIYEIVWFPADKSQTSPDEKYARTGGSSLSQVRDILRFLPQTIIHWITKKKPIGFYWKGNDPKLRQVWDRLSSKFNVSGYVHSKSNPLIYVQEKLQPMLDKIEF